MEFHLHDLQDNELIKIIDAAKLKNVTAIKEDQQKKLLARLEDYLHKKFKTRTAITKLSDPILGVTTPLVLLWSTISFINLPVALLWTAYVATNLFTIYLGKVLFVDAKEEQKRQQHKTDKELCLAILKQEALKVLLERHPNKQHEHQHWPSLECRDLKKKFTMRHRKVYFDAWLGMTSTLFCTYYIGTYSILHALALSSVVAGLASPFVLIPCLLVMLTISHYFAMAQYHASQESMYCQAWQKQAQRFVASNSGAVDAIREDLQHAAKPLQKEKKVLSGRRKKPLVATHFTLLRFLTKKEEELQERPRPAKHPSMEEHHVVHPVAHPLPSAHPH